MTRLFIQTLLLLSTYIIVIGHAHAQSAIVENFTAANCVDSQKLEPAMMTLTHDNPDILVLGCHFSINPEPTEFSDQACLDRKMQYGLKNRLAGFETPFIVVNGIYSTNWKYKNIVSSAVNLARADHELFPLPLNFEDDKLVSALPATALDNTLELWLFSYNFEGVAHIAPDEEEMDENHKGFFGKFPKTPPGKDIKFHNIVNKFTKLGDWDGTPETITIPLNGDNSDAYLLIAQEKNEGPILGSGKLERPRGQISQKHN